MSKTPKNLSANIEGQTKKRIHHGLSRKEKARINQSISHSLNIFISPTSWRIAATIFTATLTLQAIKIGLTTTSLEGIGLSIAITLLTSALLTFLSTLAINHWLLEPFLFLRKNLIAASDNPEDPKISVSPYSPHNEIGGTIQIANRMITQNANNVRHMHNKAEDRIHKIAFYDKMTGLPNRTLFIDTVEQRFEKAHKNNPESPTSIAVATIDLDNFKDINDTMGHQVGDMILKAVAKRLRNALPETAFVSRTGEDEFAVTIELDDEIQSPEDIGNKILGIFRARPFMVYNEDFQVRASVGTSLFPRDGEEPDKILKNADIALNRSKEAGRDCLKEYSIDFDRMVQERFQMLRDLRDALNNDGLTLFYQPQLDLRSGKVIGAEALIRWFKPDENEESGVKFISPAVFIPLAEQSGLVVPIGEWVAKKAIQDAKKWQDEYGYEGRIAINVSGVQFEQSDLVNYVSDLIKDTKIDPKTIELEVTESAFMDDIEGTIKVLHQLHDLGVELAIDDFGTGYSSLAYLQQFPVDRLKVDQAFVFNALKNEGDASITQTIITLGHALNLSVIAEGVETRAHEQFLIDSNCDEVQGFRYSRPLPEEEFIKFFTEYNNDLRIFDTDEEKDQA